MRTPGYLILLTALLTAPVALADSAAEITDHVTCYPRGLDMIGAGQNSDGVAVWRSCYLENFSFTLDLGWGAPTICTPSECQLPGETAIDRRAAFARSVYDRAGFTRTEHSLDNSNVIFSSPETANLTSDITAIHFGSGGSTVTGYGQWSVTLTNTEDGWRITDETLRIMRHAVLYVTPSWRSNSLPLTPCLDVVNRKIA